MKEVSQHYGMRDMQMFRNKPSLSKQQYIRSMLVLVLMLMLQLRL